MKSTKFVTDTMSLGDTKFMVSEKNKDLFYNFVECLLFDFFRQLEISRLQLYPPVKYVPTKYLKLINEIFYRLVCCVYSGVYECIQNYIMNIIYISKFHHFYYIYLRFKVNLNI